MRWTTKTKLQRLLSVMPRPLGRLLYRRIQWLHYRWQPRPPEEKIHSALALADAIRTYGSLQGAAAMEVGTGQSLNIPILLWVLGAERIICLDLQRNVTPTRVRSQLDFYRAHRTWLVEAMRGKGTSVHRLDKLLALAEKSPKRLVQRVLALCNVSYLAPADAGDIDLPARSIDIHCSNNVLEHVPPKSLYRLLGTARRLLKPGGLCVHTIDLSDHFAASDPAISSVNFLRFNQEAWDSHSSAFMYMNRLRGSQYRRIFENCGFDVLDWDSEVDMSALNLIESGELELAEQFRGLEATDLATTRAIFVALPGRRRSARAQPNGSSKGVAGGLPHPGQHEEAKPRPHP